MNLNVSFGEREKMPCPGVSYSCADPGQGNRGIRQRNRSTGTGEKLEPSARPDDRREPFCTGLT